MHVKRDDVDLSKLLLLNSASHEGGQSHVHIRQNGDLKYKNLDSCIVGILYKDTWRW